MGITVTSVGVQTNEGPESIRSRGKRWADEQAELQSKGKAGTLQPQLDPILRNMGANCLLFAGVNTDVCVMTSLQDANFNGYGCVMVEDCCGTTSPAFCTETALWQVENIYGFVAHSRNILAALKGA